MTTSTFQALLQHDLCLYSSVVARPLIKTPTRTPYRKNEYSGENSDTSYSSSINSKRECAISDNAWASFRVVAMVQTMNLNTFIDTFSQFYLRHCIDSDKHFKDSEALIIKARSRNLPHATFMKSKDMLSNVYIVQDVVEKQYLMVTQTHIDCTKVVVGSGGNKSPKARVYRNKKQIIYTRRHYCHEKSVPHEVFTISHRPVPVIEERELENYFPKYKEIKDWRVRKSVYHRR